MNRAPARHPAPRQSSFNNNNPIVYLLSPTQFINSRDDTLNSRIALNFRKYFAKRSRVNNSAHDTLCPVLARLLEHLEAAHTIITKKQEAHGRTGSDGPRQPGAREAGV